VSQPAVSVKGLGRMFGIGTQRRTFGEQLRYWAGGHYPNRNFWAIRDVTFDVPSGEGLGVIGPNGAGKSVLLRIIAGILPPTTGFAQTNGSIHPFLALDAGLVPHLPVIDNMRLCAALLGFSGRQFKQKLDDIVAFSELQEYLYANVSELSRGWQSRLAFSIAIHMDLDILLVDEALAVGDSYFRQKCCAWFLEKKKQGKTFLVASHSMEDIRSVCEKTVYINGGRVSAYGPSNDVIALYERETAEKVAQGH
jgi:ABC-type polysaccharide/polyol phosphate transport system ATPase subunit